MAGTSHLKQRYPSIVLRFVPPEGDDQRVRQEKDKFYRFLYSFRRERDANQFLKDFIRNVGPAIIRKTGNVYSVFALMKQPHRYWYSIPW